MNWQSLKNKFSKKDSGKPSLLNRFIAWFLVPRNRFRFLVLLLALDFVAFMSLTKSSYLQLVNPLAFLFVSKTEGLETMELYFPRSLSLTGIEKMYSVDEKDEGKKDGTFQEANKMATETEIDTRKLLDDEQVKAEVIAVQKMVAHPIHKIGNVELSDREAVARRVLYELIAGPSGEVATLKARNLLKEKMFLRSLWTYNDKLYITTEKKVWDKMRPNEQKITEYCIRESLKKNLPSTKFEILKQ